MKRISVLSVLFFGLSFASFAQPEHRISFGAGIFSQGFMHELSEELTEYDRLLSRIASVLRGRQKECQILCRVWIRCTRYGANGHQIHFQK